MSSIYRPLRSDTDAWADRVRQVVALMQDANGVRIPNPEDVVCNVLCNSCGRVAVGMIDHPPEGWHLGKFGENDYCPSCRG